MMEGPAVPAEAGQALEIARRCIGGSLAAAYLHGSAVAGGLRPDSDVDLLVVVDRPTTPSERACLARGLMAISGRPGGVGGRRPLELIVFHRAELAEPACPARAEFVYGEWLRAEFEAGIVPGPASDPELTLLLAQARREARALIGPDAGAMLPDIPDADIRRAIGEALPALLGTIEGDERNVLLTLARMWHTLETGAFVPKDVAAGWAIPRLSAGVGATLARAQDAYLGTARDDWRDGRQARAAAAALGRLVASAL